MVIQIIDMGKRVQRCNAEPSSVLVERHLHHLTPMAAPKVKFGFSQKRKKLSNSLGAGLHKKPSEVRTLLEAAGIGPEVRAEALTIEDWERLGKVLTKLER